VTRVLIADDHPMVLKGVEAVLAGTLFEVVARASDGAQVLEEMASARPDILLLDLQMPQRSGLDVLRTLRARGDNRAVVFLIAHIDEAKLREALNLGVNGVILKQTAPAQLIACLEQVVQGRRWTDRALQDMTFKAAFGAAPSSASQIDVLTPRERAIARLVAAGLHNHEIADELRIASSTVKVALNRIFQKVGVRNRVELALLDWLRERGE
jgi:two-component system, NarL family, nitrate/nitrite response regulator NarL